MDEFDIRVKELGERIVKLRKDRNLSQIEFAVLLDMEDSSLRRIEKGRTNPTLKTLFLISKVLDISLSDLLDY